MKKKLIAFDLDGTLADSKSPIDPKVAVLLQKLLNVFEICVISGGKFEQFDKQILQRLNKKNTNLDSLHIMPTCGTRYYRYSKVLGNWELVYAEDFTEEEKEKIIKVLKKVVDELGYNEKKVYGEIIEDRGSQITISTLGQNIVDVLGKEGVRIKEEWDPDNRKKDKIRNHAAPLLQEFEVRVGGLTSIDVTKPGIDKAYGMKRLMQALSLDKEDILFIGDRLQKGGNDYPVKEMGIDSIEIKHWAETASLLEAVLYIV